MADITQITANPPPENTDPWYAARNAFDGQVKATANAAAAKADANEAALADKADASDLDGLVPDTRTVGGKALSADVTLDAEDVGARADDWVPAWSDVADKPTFGTAAAADSTAFATAAQGAKADTAVQPGALGSAAAADVEDFATAAQGVKADDAVSTGGDALTAGAVFWGVFAEGSEPTPPDDGKIHWGFRTSA